MKTVLITGASRGIGRAAALAFARAGYAVAANYLQSEESAASLKAQILAEGGVAQIYRADVADFGAVSGMCEKIRKELGSVETLVANAGISLVKPLDGVTQSEWTRLFDVNVRGAFNAINAVSPAMVSAGRGSIITVSSVFGVSGASCEGAYSASKAAVIGLTRSLAKELGPSGVRANCVCPGVIDTEMNSNLTREEKAELCERIPLLRMGAAQEVAEAILFLASDAASYITGEVLNVGGGYEGAF